MAFHLILTAARQFGEAIGGAEYEYDEDHGHTTATAVWRNDSNQITATFSSTTTLIIVVQVFVGGPLGTVKACETKEEASALVRKLISASKGDPNASQEKEGSPTGGNRQGVDD